MTRVQKHAMHASARQLGAWHGVLALMLGHRVCVWDAAEASCELPYLGLLLYLLLQLWNAGQLSERARVRRGCVLQMPQGAGLEHFLYTCIT